MTILYLIINQMSNNNIGRIYQIKRVFNLIIKDPFVM